MTLYDKNQIQVVTSSSGCCDDVSIKLDRYRSRDYYTTDQHLAVEDVQLFEHDSRTKVHFCRRATREIQREVRARGIDVDCVFDSRLPTVIEVEITAGPDGPLVMPSGTRITEGCPGNPGQLIFLLSGTLTIAAGASARAIAVSIDFGEPYTDAIRVPLVLEDYPDASIATKAIEVAGEDHPLTLATTYKALSLIMLDYMREAGDQFDTKRKIYKEYMTAELDRAMDVGFIDDLNGDGVPDSTRFRFASRRFLRS